MPAWLPLLKASLPYVTQMVTTAIPAFTSKPGSNKVDPVMAKQIEELQSAVTNNAESIHVLAERLQQTIQGINGAAINIQKEIAKLKVMLFFASATALMAILIAAWSISR